MPSNYAETIEQFQCRIVETDGVATMATHWCESHDLPASNTTYCAAQTPIDEIKYMMHRACGEVFEQDTHNGGPSVKGSADVKDDHHRTCDALKADSLAGKSWKMNMTEDEAF